MNKKTSLSIFAISAFGSIVASSAAFAGCPPGHKSSDVTAPTNLETTFIRKGSGEFGSSRKGGKKKHQGVDIIVRATHQDKAAYSVKSIADGVIAYAQFNGKTIDKGLGNTIIIDHGNNCYSLMAHLASDPFTPFPQDPAAALMVKVGQTVKKGEVIAYFVDLEKSVESTGNARRTAKEARWQTHLEFIEAKSGIRVKNGLIRGNFGNKTVDPTATLLSLGYKVE